MVERHVLLRPALLLAAFLPATAAANVLKRAVASVGCSGYVLRVAASDLSPGSAYTVDYNFTATVGGEPTPFTGTIAFTATGGEAVATGAGSWSLTADATTLAGSATLTSSGATVPAIINGSTAPGGSAVLNCAPGSWSQEGPKLAGRGAVSGPGFPVEQGNSVSLSADGNIAVAGAPGDSDGTGAVWVFARAGRIWRQKGAKLVGAGAVGAAGQGYSAALSGDGGTLIVGGPLDTPSAGSDSAAGAAWIFARMAGGWREQAKLIGADAASPAEQGWSVALSGDGNTAVVGGPDDGNEGAVWVFARTAGAWRQQGPKLVGNGAAGDAQQGASVALSAAGNTLIVGGPRDGAVGAAWVFGRSGGVWRQEGPKLVGSGFAGAPFEGTSVALSADGNSAVIGGPRDGVAGAAWVFVRSGAVWQQQGQKLVGGDAVGPAGQGASVALDAGGFTAIVGGFGDAGGVGAAWVFAPAGAVWQQQGPKLVGTGTVGGALVGASVALSGNGRTAVVGGPGDARIGAIRIFAVNAAPTGGRPDGTDCYAEHAAALAAQFHGLAAAAAEFGFAGRRALERAMLRACGE